MLMQVQLLHDLDFVHARAVGRIDCASCLELFALMAAARFGWTYGDRLAILPPDDGSSRLEDFAGAARDHGMSVQVFCECHSALQWLLGPA
jgi:hypothetical protein